MLWIFYHNMKMFSPEILLNGKLIPVRRNGWCNTKSSKVRTHAKDSFHTSYHYSGSSSGQPVHMGTTKMRAVFSFRKLSITVWLQFPDLSTIVLCRRCIFHKIGKCLIPMPQQCFCQNQPSLRLGKDTGIFFCTGIVNHSQCSVKCMQMIWWIHQNRSILCV